MNQMQYTILKILFEKNKFNAVNSAKLTELMDTGELSYTPNTVYKQILNLMKKGYVAIGLKLGKVNLYYITSSGISMKNKLEGKED